MDLRLAHLGREDEARVASDGIILVVEVVNIVSENADIGDQRPILIAGGKADAALEVEGVGERGPLHEGGEARAGRSEEHTSELQSLMRISYAVFCLNKKILFRSTY